MKFLDKYELVETEKSQGKDLPKKKVLTMAKKDVADLRKEMFKLEPEVVENEKKYLNFMAEKCHKVLGDEVAKDGIKREFRANNLRINVEGKKEVNQIGSKERKIVYGHETVKLTTGSIAYLKGDSDDHKKIIDKIKGRAKSWK